MRACSSGVSFGSRRSGSSAGSPIGSEPSGSSRAARWPCIRCALTSAIAAATPPSSSGRRRGAARRLGRRAAVAATGAAAGRRRDAARRCRVPLARGSALEQPREPGRSRTSGGVAALEERAPLRRDSLGVVEILVEEQTRVAGIHAVDVTHCDPCFVPAREVPAGRRWKRLTDRCSVERVASPRRRTRRRSASRA